MGNNEIIEKAKQWQVGDEQTDKHGVTYYVHALNAAGKPLWRKKKDSGAKNATSATETEEHMKSSLAKIEENIKTIKNALANASDVTAGKLQNMLTASVSKKKAIEDALKDKKNGSTKRPVSFVPKQTFKNA